jgi:hypothetical protein
MRFEEHDSAEEKAAWDRLTETERSVCRQMRIKALPFLRAKEERRTGATLTSPPSVLGAGERVWQAVALELGLAADVTKEAVQTELSARAQAATRKGMVSDGEDWKRVAQALSVIEGVLGARKQARRW